MSEHTAAMAPWAARFLKKSASDGMTDRVVDQIVRDVAELPDRTSPEDQPDMMLVTADELTLIVRRVLTQEGASEALPDRAQRGTPTPSSPSPRELALEEALKALADAAEVDLKANQGDEDDPGGWWSMRTERAIEAARALLSLSREKEGCEPALPGNTATVIEQVLFRRVVQNRIEGFTMETAWEILAALKSPTDSGGG